ncbi:hypothetical protein VKT23_013859 [Stygiomarasmius scandens]|uniref:Uncharacterized protein n=1 Tax=Marasmiellus scandens TaxID=2682957 RepID=A0ABR1J2F4_9AGAR
MWQWVDGIYRSANSTIHLLIIADIHTKKRGTKTFVTSIEFDFLIPVDDGNNKDKEHEKEDMDGSEDEDEGEGEDEGKDEDEGEDGDEDEDENGTIAGPRTYTVVQSISIPGEGPVTENLRLHVSWIYGLDFADGRPDWLPLSCGLFEIPAPALGRLRDFVVDRNADWGAQTVPKKRSRPPKHDVEDVFLVDPARRRKIKGWASQGSQHKVTRRSGGRRKGGQRVQKDE